MNLYELFYRTEEREGVEKAQVQKRPEGMALFWLAISQNPWDMIKLNLAFLISCIPIITIPAALAALFGMNYRFLLGKHIDFLSDYWELFKESFKRATVIGLLSMILMFAISFAIYFYATLAASELMFAFVAVLLSMLLLSVITMSFYVYPMLILTDLRMVQIIKNAFYLTIVCLPRNALTLVVIAVLLIIAIFSFPISLLIYAVMGFSLFGIIIAFSTYKGIMKYVIRD